MKQAHFLLAVSALLVPFVVNDAAVAKPAPKHKAQKEQAAAEPTRHQVDAQDLKAIDTVTVDLKSAIAAAEEKTGGKVVDILLDASNGPAKYDAIVVKNDAVLQAKIDAASGAVQQLPARKSKDAKEYVDEAKALQPDVTSLAAYVGTLEEQHGAKAVDAEVQLFGDFVIYDLQLAKNGSSERVAIEAKSGRPIANPRALENN